MADQMAEGLEKGWRVQDASTMEHDLEWETDVVIVGTGAGGGMAAEVLTLAGLEVVLVEEGPLKSSSDFRMRELDAYADLYHEKAARQTRDKAVAILQGRCVGGGTTINWTSSFVTPEKTLNHWRDHFNVTGCSVEEMKPWFDSAIARLSMAPWSVAPNANNEILRRGAQRLGWEWAAMDRNVIGCANLGACGLGCPIDAKQSMLVTTPPSALEGGARLLTRTRAIRLEYDQDRVTCLVCAGLDARGVAPGGRTVRIRARHYVLSAGAIGSPALLLRSQAPDPYQLTGKRTFLHPTTLSLAEMPDRVDPFRGAPQSLYSNEFLWKQGVTGPYGYKLEVPPLFPMSAATLLSGFGADHFAYMQRLPYLQATLALGRDGFHEDSPGGKVLPREDGSPLLDYPLTPYLLEGIRRGFLHMAELQFAAGAKHVTPQHRQRTTPWTSFAEARVGVSDLSMRPGDPRVFSAHVQGGCPLGEDPRRAVVDSMGFHHQLGNVSVLDGSVFPTSIGANPQLSIYAMSLKNATALASRLAGP